MHPALVHAPCACFHAPWALCHASGTFPCVRRFCWPPSCTHALFHVPRCFSANLVLKWPFSSPVLVFSSKQDVSKLGNIISPFGNSSEASWIFNLRLSKDHINLWISCFADLHDFFVNYINNTLKLLCFGKTLITDSNIENITNVSKPYAITLILLCFVGKTYWIRLKNMLRIT